ncbi:S-protein homolog 27-like [Raphanus sativus]|uniref:S-protein homolog n=1 Tax=Raphanus sativus TaxID=3726 RepID=A0A9W3D853_RAPSA|nr:S-protein homolog 27-like [Raphanus sativus]
MFTKIITVWLFICSSGLQQNKEPTYLIRPFTKIMIQNDNEYLLGVHCKSKDDDIGIRSLKKGEIYRWKFHINFPNSTFFFCGFSRGQINKGVFDIYVVDRDYNRCTKCMWRAGKDGLYGSGEFSKTSLCVLAYVFFKWIK